MTSVSSAPETKLSLSKSLRVDARFDGVLLTLMVIALSIQGPALFFLDSMDFTLGHLMVGLMGAAALLRCLLSGRRLVMPPAAVNVLFVVFALVTVIDTARFGFGSMIFKYAFQYLVLFVALNLMNLMDSGNALLAVKRGAVAVFALVLLNACVHVDAFFEYYSNPWDGHPEYETLISGGLNLEATWPAMLGVFMPNNRRGWIYLIASVVFSALVQSRAGLVLAGLALAYVLLIKDGGRPSLQCVLVVAITAVAACAITVAGPRAAVHAAYLESMQEQEASIQELPSSADSNADASLSADANAGPAQAGGLIGTPGRKGIWAASLQVLRENFLFGHGAGNAMDAVRALSGYPYRENNVHNYPLQVLIDFGFVGFAAFAVVVVRYLISNFKARFRSPFAAFIALYLIGGLIQFAGGELLVGFAMAGLIVFGPYAGRPNLREVNLDE